MGNLCGGSSATGQVEEKQPIIRKPHEDISVAEFLSVCVYLTEECGKVIRQVQESGELKTQEKGKDGPVT